MKSRMFLDKGASTVELSSPGSGPESTCKSPPLARSTSSEDDGQLSPLDGDMSLSFVRGRLRKVIEEKRALNGRESSLDLYSPSEQCKLDPEQITQATQRERVRKERNRLAAQRMRERRKRYCDTLVQELMCLENSNKTLQTEIGTLEDERIALEGLLKTHMKICEKSPMPSSKPNRASSTLPNAISVITSPKVSNDSMCSNSSRRLSSPNNKVIPCALGSPTMTPISSSSVSPTQISMPIRLASPSIITTMPNAVLSPTVLTIPRTPVTVTPIVNNCYLPQDINGNTIKLLSPSAVLGNLVQPEQPLDLTVATSSRSISQDSPLDLRVRRHIGDVYPEEEARSRYIDQCYTDGHVSGQSRHVIYQRMNSYEPVPFQINLPKRPRLSSV